MQRRTFVGSVVAIGAVIAGCSSDADDSSGPSNDQQSGTPTPTLSAEEAARAVLKRSWEAYKAEDVEALEETYHPDSPVLEQKPWESDGYFGPDGAEFKVLKRILVDGPSDGEVTFWDRFDRVTDKETQKRYYVVKLRIDDKGEWGIWDSEIKPASKEPPT